MNENILHIIVLTKDRPQTLKRCLNSICNHNVDRITIIDDSSSKYFKINFNLLEGFCSCTELSHFSSKSLFDSLKIEFPIAALEWSEKRYERDIAPLRNLSLLFSLCETNKCTILIDDDIRCINLNLIIPELEKIVKKSKSFIAGVNIAGIDEYSTIERLELALYKLQHFNTIISPFEIKSLFQRSEPKLENHTINVKYVSGGFLAFFLAQNIQDIVAYPPGYNEDWLWCMEIQRRGISKVIKLPHKVVHDPPFIRKVKVNDLKFELLGNLIFDLANETDFMKELYSEGLVNSLVNISKFVPTSDFDNVIKLSHKLKNSNILNNVGLYSLKKFYNQDFQYYDWIGEVNKWINEARRKQKSFQLALSLGIREKIKDIINILNYEKQN